MGFVGVIAKLSHIFFFMFSSIFFKFFIFSSEHFTKTIIHPRLIFTSPSPNQLFKNTFNVLNGLRWLPLITGLFGLKICEISVTEPL